MTRTPFLAANWKMFKTVHEAVAYAKEFRALVKDLDDVEIVVAPPFTALHAVAEALAQQRSSASPARTSTGRRKAPSPARSARRCSRRPGAEFVDHRPLRAAPDVRRHRRGRQPQDAGGHPARAVPDRLRRRDARGARSATAPSRCSIGRSRPASTASRPSRWPTWCSPTSRSGPSAPAATPRREQAGEAHAHIRERLQAVVRGGRGREVPHPLRRQRQAGQRRRPWRRCPTSTARWSAAPAWIRTVSPRS